MGNDDKKKIFEFGQWLEIYLNHSSKHFEYKKLAKLFIDSHNIDFKLRDNDFTLEFIELLKSQNKSIYQQYTIGRLRKKIFNPYNINFYDDAKVTDPIDVSKFVTEKTIYNIDNIKCSKDTHKEWQHKADNMMFHIFDSMELIKILLQEICNTKDSYVKILNAWHDKEVSLFKYFWSSYGSTTTNLIVKNGSLSVRHSLTDGFSSDTKMPSIFPWMSASSIIFFDFLRCGGQKYIIFCKHCGRFSYTKRLKPDGTPEKEFCSNVCRTAFKRA